MRGPKAKRETTKDKRDRQGILKRKEKERVWGLARASRKTDGGGRGQHDSLPWLFMLVFFFFSLLRGGFSGMIWFKIYLELI